MEILMAKVFKTWSFRDMKEGKRLKNFVILAVSFSFLLVPAYEDYDFLISKMNFDHGLQVHWETWHADFDAVGLGNRLLFLPPASCMVVHPANVGIFSPSGSIPFQLSFLDGKASQTLRC
jgi:hypothetical protein